MSRTSPSRTTSHILFQANWAERPEETFLDLYPNRSMYEHLFCPPPDFFPTGV
ncbi:hypothetical protein Vi05172_g4709 [Venturia inaequalis]|nr:hypothetical protein Vi05172_g4709 [Venturia inaequalis]